MSRRDKFMIRFDSIACTVLNGVRMVADYFDVNGKTLLKRNQGLKRSCQSEEKDLVCFVLGNGPSLDLQTLDAIAQYPTITVNFFHKGFADFNSTYHLCIDPAFGDAVNEPDAVKHIQKLVQEKRDTKFLFSMKAGKAFMHKKKDMPENVYFIKCNRSQHDNLVCANICKPMTMGPNVLPTAIQCAIAMGYKKVYLLGCEFGLYGLMGRGHHYDQTGKLGPSHDVLDHLIRCGLVHAHHQAIAKYCKEKGITIQNLTPVSNLWEYPINTLENVLKTMTKG